VKQHTEASQGESGSRLSREHCSQHGGQRHWTPLACSPATANARAVRPGHTTSPSCSSGCSPGPSDAF